jgi:hypothetical protein
MAWLTDTAALAAALRGEPMTTPAPAVTVEPTAPALGSRLPLALAAWHADQPRREAEALMRATMPGPAWANEPEPQMDLDPMPDTDAEIQTAPEPEPPAEDDHAASTS